MNAVLEKVKTNSIGVTLPPLAQLENVLTSQSLALAGTLNLCVACLAHALRYYSSLCLQGRRCQQATGPVARAEAKHGIGDEARRAGAPSRLSLSDETATQERTRTLDFVRRVYVGRGLQLSLTRAFGRVVQSNLNGSYDMLEEHIKQLERQKVLFVASQDPDAYGFTPAPCTGGRERSPLVGEKRGYGTMAAPCDSMYVPPLLCSRTCGLAHKRTCDCWCGTPHIKSCTSKFGL